MTKLLMTFGLSFSLGMMSMMAAAVNRVAIQHAIPAASYDLEVAFELDVSQSKSFKLSSDQDVVVETNDGTNSDNTFTLAAGVPYAHPETQGAPFTDTEGQPVSTDIAALYVTNATGNDALLRIDSITK